MKDTQQKFCHDFLLQSQDVFLAKSRLQDNCTAQPQPKFMLEPRPQKYQSRPRRQFKAIQAKQKLYLMLKATL